MVSRLNALGEYLILRPLPTGSRTGSPFLFMDEGLQQYEVESVGNDVAIPVEQGDIVLLADKQLTIEIEGHEEGLIATITGNVLGKV